MSATRLPRQAIDGVLLLDKPFGISSQTAVTRVKTLFNAAKAGHTGTLDPMATGLLPVVFGEASKFSSALLEASKAYLAIIRLGLTTTSGDLEGEVTGQRPVRADLADIHAVLQQFRGEIVQTPPMYSALKHAGKPLYRYAREGIEVERAPRRVVITRLTCEGLEGVDLRIAVECSKGTYVRVLAEDIGSALGCGGCLAMLRRTRVGAFDVASAVGFDALSGMPEPDRGRTLLPVDALLAGVPELALDEAQARRVARGQSIDWERTPGPGLVRLYGPDRRFLGIGEAGLTGQLQPRRLMATKPATKAANG